MPKKATKATTAAAVWEAHEYLAAARAALATGHAAPSPTQEVAEEAMARAHGALGQLLLALGELDG